MKHILSLFLLVSSIALFAEDTITLVSNQIIVANITSISSSEIVYKDVSMPDGPDFVLKKDEVALITFRNGITQTYNPIITTSISTQEEDDGEDVAVSQTSQASEEDGFTYTSTDGKIKFRYDFAKKRIYLQVDQPLMYNTKDVRNISITSCHIDKKELYLIFDMANKVEGVAILSGLSAFICNIDFHRYFKKHMPRTFVIEIPYETKHVSYKMQLSN